MAWYKTGKDAYDQHDEEEKKRAEQRDDWFFSKYARLWLKPETHIVGTFLDGPTHPDGYDLPFVLNEHQLQIDDDWKNWFTCLQGLKVSDFIEMLGTSDPEKLAEEGILGGPDDLVLCPLCEGDNKPYLIAAYTLQNHTEWEDKRGNKHRDDHKLFCVKSMVFKTMRLITSMKEGNLRGCTFNIKRTSKDTANSGDALEYLSSKELPDTLQPAPYLEAFKPLTPRRIQDAISGVTEDGVDPEDDETIPF